MVIYDGPHWFHITITAVDMYTLDSRHSGLQAIAMGVQITLTALSKLLLVASHKVDKPTSVRPIYTKYHQAL
jgi:hypothetical protein